MEKDFSSIKVKKYTKDQFSHIQRFLRIKRKKMFISHDTALMYLIELAKEVKNIDTKTDITEKDLKYNLDFRYKKTICESRWFFVL